MDETSTKQTPTSQAAAMALVAPVNTTQPFDEIALALSGGGYRAAAFHLGTLDMLHRLRLLQSVRVLSTVSGGTLTGLKYALSAAEGVSFEKFYREFYDFLGDTNVIGLGLGGLKPAENSPFANQMPSLIRSAAHVYSSPRMVGNKTFGLILNDQTSHLREASFNATEFRTGNYFRFQRSASARAIIGNGNFSIKKNVALQIRLADIAAASSCFPSVFEPIRFPDDFLWSQKLEEVRSALGDKFTENVPLMDGGIHDNQGVDSVVRAYDRKGSARIGLLIISDTNQRDPSLFDFAPAKKRGFVKISHLAKLACVVFIISAASAAILILALVLTPITVGFYWVHFFLYFVAIIFSSFLAVGLWWIRRSYREGQRYVAEMTTLELWPFLKRLTLPEVIDLISGRAKSLIALTSAVFLKRIRDMVYKDINVHPRYRRREVANLIYDLDDLGKFPDPIVAQLGPTEEFRKLAVAAEGTATALWITGDRELRDLVACGQVTTCFTILRYILDERSAELGMTGSREEQIYNDAIEKWEQLKQDPYTFLR